MKHKQEIMGQRALEASGAYNCKWCGLPYLQLAHEKNCGDGAIKKNQRPPHTGGSMGSAAKRNDLDWTEIGMYLRKLLRKIPKKAVVAFLDGLATKEKKTAGVAAYVLGPAGENGERTEFE